DGTWKGTVGVAEHLGSDTFFHIHGTELAETITVRASGEIELRHGDDIYLTPREDRIHKFGADGLRVA
ncbi:MAG: sugar ABC transporter ATP-binding protein, partial [Pseudomonadota bacterium]